MAVEKAYAFIEPRVHGWPEHACIGCPLGADQVSHLARPRQRGSENLLDKGGCLEEYYQPKGDQGR